MMSLQCFDGKNVIVAGVGGIGRASAVLLASLGAKIIMIDANESSMKDTLSCLLYTSPSPRD